MLKKIVGAAAASVLLIYIGFAITAPKSVDPEQYLALANAYDVRIVRDAYGVPHIFGARDVDVAFGLAVAHSEDDFATIQDVLLATRGKLATLHGPKAAKTDYLIQFMRVWDVVNAGYETRVSAKARAHAEAYADGINFYAAEHPGNIAANFLPVTGKDIVAGYTFKTPLFYGFDQDVAAVAEGRYGTGLDKLALLIPTDAPQPDIGSQGIALAPSRTDDGFTRLLVNSHQPLTGPVAWYEARVKSEEGWDMAGSTFPGSPLIIHGHGPTLGWANTVNKPDLVDVYALTINPDNENQYLLDGTWHDLEVRDAAINVTFFGPIRWTFHEPLYFSAHGPVFKTAKGAFAMRWAGMGEVDTLDLMLGLNKARTQEDFEAALALGTMPSINYIYADKDGNIAHYYNAMLPKRLEGVNWQGLLPGDRSDLIWTEYYPFEKVPRTVNPPSGFVYNANNSPYEATTGPGGASRADFPATMGVETHMTNRALRIREIFGRDTSISREELHAYKYDNSYDKNSVTGKAISAILQFDFVEGSDQKKGQKILESWDMSTGVNNRAAALAVLTTQPLVMANMQHKPAPDLQVTYHAALALLKKHFGRLDPEWGSVNRLVRGDKNLPVAGAPDVLRAIYADFNEEAGHLEARAGDSYIMFVEWSPSGAVSSRSVHNFGSATLDKNSPHYSDQVPMFAAESDRKLPLDMAALEAEKTNERHIGRGH